MPRQKQENRRTISLRLTESQIAHIDALAQAVDQDRKHILEFAVNVMVRIQVVDAEDLTKNLETNRLPRLVFYPRDDQRPENDLGLLHVLPHSTKLSVEKKVRAKKSPATTPQSTPSEPPDSSA